MFVQQKWEGSKVSIVQFKEYFDIDIKELEELFASFQDQKIILSFSFKENVWMLNNERIGRRLVFDLDEVLYNKEMKIRELCPFKDVINALKGFALYKLKSFPIETVYSAVQFIKGILKTTAYFNVAKKKELIKKNFKKDYAYYSQLHTLIEFLEYFSMDIDDDYLNLLYHQSETYYQYVEDSQFKNRRKIGRFDSIFEMGYIIDLFWDTCSKEEKEEFYPIKLWWEITTVIPLRVSEFLLTPHNCISQVKDKFYLTIRRTNLKTNNGTAKHKIEEDYKLHPIRINESLYNLIKDYRDLVDDYDFMPDYFYKGYEHTGRRKFLFSQRSYFKYLRFKGATGKNSYILELFNVANINRLLRQFYQRIIIDRFHYEVVPKLDRTDKSKDKESRLVEKKDEGLKPYRMEQVNLMDTRHYAFINLVLNDVEPLFIKDISGHSSIRSSYHYYSHVNTFVKCYTYNLARRISRKEKAKKGEHIIDVSNKTKHSQLAFNKVFNESYAKEFEEYPDVFGGKCASKQENYEDCNANAFICEGCSFFCPTQTEAQERIKEKILQNQMRVETEAKALEELIQQFDKIQNFNEDYSVKINRIKTIALQNSAMLSKYFL